MGTDATIRNMRTGKDVFIDRLKNISNEYTTYEELIPLKEGRMKKKELVYLLLSLSKIKELDKKDFYMNVIHDLKEFNDEDQFKLLSENDEEYWEGMRITNT